MRPKEVERIVIIKKEVNDFFFDSKSVWYVIDCDNV